MKRCQVLLFFCAKSDSDHLTIGFAGINDYLQKIGLSWKAIVMIDKDATERKTLINLGLSCILCEFHVMKIFRPWIKKRICAIYRIIKMRKDGRITHKI